MGEKKQVEIESNESSEGLETSSQARQGGPETLRVFKSHLKKGCLSFLPLFRKNPCEQLFEQKSKTYFLLNPD